MIEAIVMVMAEDLLAFFSCVTSIKGFRGRNQRALMHLVASNDFYV